MTLTATEPAPTQPDGRHRWPIIAVAAATVVAIVVGALMLAARDDSAPVPADTPAPVVPDVTTADEEVARGFLDAYVANDADQAVNNITESAITETWGSVEEFRGEIAWNAATGYKMMINECEPLDNDPAAGATLRCGFDFHMLGSDALGNGPYRANYWDLTIRDGQIVAEERVRPNRTGGTPRRGTPSNSGSRPSIPTTCWSCTPTLHRALGGSRTRRSRSGNSAPRNSCRPC